MKILLIGASGQLGSEIGELVRAGGRHELLAPSRDQLDLARLVDDAEGADDDLIASSGADAIINCAAFHRVPVCEAQPLDAFKINCVAVERLARHALTLGARFMTYSTDYVFGGDQEMPYLESARPAPLQMYGISKAAGEQAALSAYGQGTLIVRTCGVYGKTGSRSKGGLNFVDQRIADAKAGATEVEIAREQIVSPTSAVDLAQASLELLEHPQHPVGIFHLVNEGACSWAEFAAEIYRAAGLSTRVKPVDRGGFTGDMRRPLYSALANTRAASLGVMLADREVAVARYVQHLR